MPLKSSKRSKSWASPSFVDPCPMELGRDPEFAAECADKSGLNVVVATGLYNEALGIPPHFRSLPADDIAEIYVREITDGIDKTGIKAGIIKTATGGIPGMTETAKNDRYARRDLSACGRPCPQGDGYSHPLS